MFKIGDRVTVNNQHPLRGQNGTVVLLPDDKGDFEYIRKGFGIEFDNPHYLLHSLRGKTPKDRGFWILPEYLELIKPKSEKIVITHDDKTTLARLYENNKVVKSAEAKCSPDDEFDFLVGAKIAFERLTEEKEAPPKFDKSMLTSGRFGYMEKQGWFVVVGDHLVYEKGGWDFVKTFDENGSTGWYSIKYIVESEAFNYAKNDKRVIWCAPDFDPKKVK